MDVDTDIYENRDVNMDVDTEFVENRGMDMDMDTAWNRCPPNSGTDYNLGSPWYSVTWRLFSGQKCNGHLL